MVVMNEQDDRQVTSAKLEALARALDKAKRLETYLKHHVKVHGAFQMGLATGKRQGLEDAFEIMTSKSRYKTQ